MATPVLVPVVAPVAAPALETAPESEACDEIELLATVELDASIEEPIELIKEFLPLPEDELGILLNSLSKATAFPDISPLLGRTAGLVLGGK